MALHSGGKMELISMKQASKTYKIPYPDIIRFAESGRLKSIVIKKTFKTTEDWVRSFLEEQANYHRPKLTKIRV
jgi:hypothetical protein